jgi:hypothetical protein
MRRRITRQDKVRFMQGSCYQLAKALHDITGWPMYAYWDGAEYDIHVFVETPTGTYLDINGEHTKDQMLARWAMWSTDIRLVTDYATQLAWWDNDNPHFDSMPRAREVAEELVYRYRRDNAKVFA